MKPMLKVGLVVVAIIVALAMSLLLFKESILTVVLLRYFESKSVSAELRVEKLDLNLLRLRDIRINEKILVDSVELAWTHGKQGWFEPRHLKVNVKNMDIESVLEVAAAWSGEGESSPMSFDGLLSDCQSLLAIKPEVFVERLSLGESLPEIHGEIRAQGEELVATLGVAGESGSLSVSCRPEEILVRVSAFELKTSLSLKEAAWKLSKLKLNSTGLQVRFDPKDRVLLDGEIGADIHAESVDQQIEMELESLKIKGEFGLEAEDLGYLDLEAKNVEVSEPVPLVISSLNLKLNFPFEPLTGKFSVRDLSYLDVANDKKTPLLAGLILAGEFSSDAEGYRAQMDVTDKTKSLRLNKLLLRHNPERGLSRIELSSGVNRLELRKDLEQLLPMVKDMMNFSGGEIHFRGSLESSAETLRGPLRFELKNAHLDLASSVNVQGLEMRGQLLDASRIEMDSIKFVYDEARVKTLEAFTLYYMEPSFEGLKLGVTGASLEKILSLALKDSIKSEGFLEGAVELSFKNKIPAIEGGFKSQGPGRVRYDSGLRPHQLIQLSDGPMEILKSYLYDFHYETLSVDIKTDQNYKMLMALGAYGRNPDYLRGKPLKLNVNIEQNILAAFQSMMLTYDLPNQLKEFWEKSEKK